MVNLPFTRRVGVGPMLMLAAALLGVPTGAATAQGVARILEQDPARNNLVDPPGYTVGELGRLGRVEKWGRGPQAMILIPGLGFGGEVFETFMAGWHDTFTTYAVTLPGMGGTPAPPSPPQSESFGAQTWTNGAVRAVERLMDDEGLEDVVLVGHWLTGTQVALRLALGHPDRIRAVVLPAGSARWVTPEPNPAQPDSIPLPQRIARVDGYLAPQWFKTVTRETWDDNNFLPGDYATHPVLALRLWRQAARPPLHVWIRYLNEFYAQDATLELADLTVPTLLLKPGLDGIFHESGANYVFAYADRGWGRWAEGRGLFEVHTIPDSRIVPWVDQPALVDEAVADFLGLARASGGPSAGGG